MYSFYIEWKYVRIDFFNIKILFIKVQDSWMTTSHPVSPTVSATTSVQVETVQEVPVLTFYVQPVQVNYVTISIELVWRGKIVTCERSNFREFEARKNVVYSVVVRVFFPDGIAVNIALGPQSTVSRSR